MEWAKSKTTYVHKTKFFRGDKKLFFFINLTTKDTDLAKVCNGYSCQKVKFQRSSKSTIPYSESEVMVIVYFGMLSIDSNFRVKRWRST